ncbi:hypothetical protein FTX61_19205 [Nitriliruptoraceae bacterium ZYF776]|nr:hypothetical protein [Profundirhabdus halotolerans]
MTTLRSRVGPSERPSGPAHGPVGPPDPCRTGRGELPSGPIGTHREPGGDPGAGPTAGWRDETRCRGS